MRRRGLPFLLGAVLTAGCATSAPPRVSATPAPAPTPAPQGDTLRGLGHEQLHAVLWVQTSAEYATLMTTTYAAATAALEPALADTSWTAALEQQGDFAGLPPAVIADVDETLLDNSPFQAQEILEGTAYCDKSWPAWTAQARARALPGARAFARAAADRGVTMFYVTNRSKDEEAATVANLKCAGRDAAGQCLAFPNADPEHVLVPGEAPAEGEKAWTSDKTARRAHVARSHRILLLVGDDLRDFVSTPPGATPDDRVQLARGHGARWGKSWFLLPNPAYGSWERALPGAKLDEAGFLKAKRERLEGFRPPQAPECRPAQK